VVDDARCYLGSRGFGLFRLVGEHRYPVIGNDRKAGQGGGGPARHPRPGSPEPGGSRFYRPRGLDAATPVPARWRDLAPVSGVSARSSATLKLL
jgi:hypothetical protein